MAEVQREGKLWANVRFAGYRSSELHDVIVALTFETCWRFSSNQVPQPSWGNRSAGWDTKCLIRKTLSWFVAGTRTFGASVVSIPAETDHLILPLTWWWHQASGTKMTGRGWTKQIAFIIIFWGYLHLLLIKHGMWRDLGWITSS